MSAPRIILASLPSFCQKLSKLVEIWRRSDKNNFAQFFLRHDVYWRQINVDGVASSLTCLSLVLNRWREKQQLSECDGYKYSPSDLSVTALRFGRCVALLPRLAVGPL